MHFICTHCKYTRDTEVVLYELSKIYEENKYHPYDYVRPYHKDSRGLWGKSRSDNYGKEVDICNSNKEYFDWENEELEEYSGLVEEEGRNHHPELAEDLLGI